ncbi:MAG: hypothetical protein U5Q44_04770 [Dehalococcoidia bacterium]|nr:hypothetical protein [Dehalococcoidia bacterium]
MCRPEDRRVERGCDVLSLDELGGGECFDGLASAIDNLQRPAGPPGEHGFQGGFEAGGANAVANAIAAALALFELFSGQLAGIAHGVRRGGPKRVDTPGDKVEQQARVIEDHEVGFLCALVGNHANVDALIGREGAIEGPVDGLAGKAKLDEPGGNRGGDPR